MGSRVVRRLLASAPRLLGLGGVRTGSRQCGPTSPRAVSLLDGARTEPLGVQPAGCAATLMLETVDPGFAPAFSIAPSPAQVSASTRGDSSGQVGMMGTASGWYQQQLRLLCHSALASSPVLSKTGVPGALSAEPLPPWRETFDLVKRRDNSAQVGYTVVESSSSGQMPSLAEYFQGEGGGQIGGTPTGRQTEGVDTDSSDGDTEEPEIGTVVAASASGTELALGGQGQVRRRPVFAVVQVGSHQFKVTPGDSIYCEKLLFAGINDVVHLNKVLLLGSRYETVIGRPTIHDAHVVALVEEQALDAKVIVFKKRRRKNYRRHRGHRQHLTRLLILDVVGIQDVAGEAMPAKPSGSDGVESAATTALG